METTEEPALTLDFDEDWEPAEVEEITKEYDLFVILARLADDSS